MASCSGAGNGVRPSHRVVKWLHWVIARLSPNVNIITTPHTNHSVYHISGGTKDTSACVKQVYPSEAVWVGVWWLRHLAGVVESYVVPFKVSSRSLETKDATQNLRCR